MFATLLRPDGGRARVLGQDVAAVRRVIGRTGQYAALDDYLTGRANLVMRLSAPVAAVAGLMTTVVRALDAAGVQVDDVTLQRASLDGVFLSLTGHAAAGSVAA